MNKLMKEYLTDIVTNKNLTVIEGCIPSLQMSIEISNLPENKKEEMLSLLSLIENHYKGVALFVRESINYSQKCN